MSNTFDHVLEAYERMETGEGEGWSGRPTIPYFRRHKLGVHMRICSKGSCGHTFKSNRACACPECGGWTNPKE